GLRVGRLVVRRVGGGQFAAIYQEHTAALPAPAVGGLVLDGAADGVGQPPEKVLGQLGAGLTVGAGVGGAGRQPAGDAEGDDTGPGSDAGLAAAEGLGEEGPEGDGRRVDVVGAGGEIQPVVVGGLLEGGFREGLVEGESRVVGKG